MAPDIPLNEAVNAHPQLAVDKPAPAVLTIAEDAGSDQ
jgi:hypothetical protein